MKQALLKIPLYRLLFPFMGLVLFLLSSCAPEREIGKQFVQYAPGISLQVFTPNILYKNNHKGEDVQGFDSMTPNQQDSALYYSSRFIQYVNDSIYITKYRTNFIDELRALGFKVYVDTALQDFLKGQPQSYLLNMAQEQLDEYNYPYEDSEQFGDSVFVKRINLNAVDASSWFEVSKLNAPNPVKTVLYSTFTATDALNGRFFNDPFTGSAKYNYSIDSLNVNDLYDLATYSGKKNASYLFDFFMNQYISFHLPEGVEPSGKFHYNRFNKSIVRDDQDQFEVLDALGGSK